MIILKKYCVYLTIYSGNKLPPFYIGSTSLENIKNGYLGSVSSKEYKRIWKSEIKENRHLFKIKIISSGDDRDKVFLREQDIHKKLNVAENNLYVNKSIALLHFNMKGKKQSESAKRKISKATKGKNNPNYGKKASNILKAKLSFLKKNIPLSENHKNKIKVYQQTFWNSTESDELRKHFSKLSSGENNPMYGSQGGMFNKQHSNETKQKMSNSAKKPKSKTHVMKMSNIFKIEQQSTGKIEIGRNLTDFCKKFSINISSLTYTLKSKKFIYDFKILEKIEKTKTNSEYKLLSELF